MKSPNNSPLSECVADTQLADEIEKRGRHFDAGPDGLLFRQDDLPTCLYFVKSGEVELTMKVGSKVVMEVWAGTGSLVGLPAIVGRRPYTMGAKVCQGADVYQLTADAFGKLLRDEPQLTMNILRILAGEIRSARTAITGLLG